MCLKHRVYTEVLLHSNRYSSLFWVLSPNTERYTYMYYIYNLWHRSCYMHKIYFIKESRWPQSSFRHYIVHQVTGRDNWETIVNFEPKSNCKYHHSSSVYDELKLRSISPDISRSLLSYIGCMVYLFTEIFESFGCPIAWFQQLIVCTE